MNADGCASDLTIECRAQFKSNICLEQLIGSREREEREREGIEREREIYIYI